MNQDLVMESVHGRKNKSQTTFKAVLNKVLVSALILGTVAGMSTPAFAAELSIKDQVNGVTANQEIGVSVQDAISSLRNTIASINQMKANGSVSESQIKTLANQLYTLEKASKGSVTSDVISVINDAESAIKGLSNATDAHVAIAVVKNSLGIETVTVSNKSATVTSFSDVKSDHWAHSAIMAMTAKGLFSGKGEIIDGVGRFAPDDTMSRAEFVTVVIRALYKSELDAMPKSEGAWYQNAHTIAIQNGILQSNELDRGNLSKPMTRQEMAMVLVRAAEKNGETPSQLVDTSRIADYKTVGNYYQDYVVQAYSMGMISGTDKQGTFSPMGTLNRAQAATVLYRLVEASSRADVDFNATVTPPVNQGQAQEFTEGSVHSIPKVGDVVIKSDGTRVVIKEGIAGVLGAGQGVDIWTGVQLSSGRLIKEGVVVGDISQEPFSKDPISGEMHPNNSWALICNATDPTGSYVGDYDGEVYGTWWKWDTGMMGGAWMWQGPMHG